MHQHSHTTHPDTIRWALWAILAGIALNCILAVLAHAQCAPNDLICMNLP